MNNKVIEGKKGFTLIEVIVVLVILAILAAALIPSMIGYVKDSKEKVAYSNIGIIKRSLVTAAADVDVKKFEDLYIPASGYKGNYDEDKFYKNITKELDPDFKGNYYIMISIPSNERNKIGNINKVVEKYATIYFGEKGYFTKPYYVYKNNKITRVE